MQLITQMGKQTFNVMDFEPCEASRALEEGSADGGLVLSVYVAPVLKAGVLVVSLPVCDVLSDLSHRCFVL